MIDWYGILAIIATQYIEIMMLLRYLWIRYKSRRLTHNE